jgi:hypothetical protein
MIKSEIPQFLYQLSFHRHMANIVPVTKIITEENKNSKELNPNKMHY